MTTEVIEGVVESGAPKASEKIVEFIEKLVSTETGHKVRVKHIQFELDTPDGVVKVNWKPKHD